MANKRTFIAIMLMPLAALFFAGGKPALAAPSRSERDQTLVQELETHSRVAWKGHDYKFFAGFLSDDHVEIHSYGITGKAAVVAGVRSPACQVQAYSLGPFTAARVAADAILLTYRAEQDTSCGGQKVPSPVWATSLYVKRGGKWLNVMYQQTPLAHG